MRAITRFYIFIFVLFACGLNAGVLLADVTVERYYKTSGIGGLGAFESNEKESIKGQRKFVASEKKMKSKLLGKFMGDGKSSVIYIVEKDTVYTLNHAKKTYTKRSISPPKEDEKGARSEERYSEESGGEEEEKTRVVKNELKMKKTGEKKTINGFPCSEYLLTWLVETENIETKERSKSLMTGEFWTTPETKKIRQLKEDEGRFNRAYLKKLGVEMSPADMKRFGLSMLGAMAGSSGKDLGKEMSKMKGYPIVTSIKWETEKAGGEEVGEEGGIDLKKGIGGFLGGLKKKAFKSRGKGEKKPAFESYVEIKSIDTGAVSGELFKVPAGYKERKGLFGRR